MPGLVDVTLSKDPQPNAAEYGTSIAKFQYLRDQDQLLPILMRIQGQAYPEFAPVLQALFAALSAPQGNQILQGGSQSTIETGLVHALSSIQALPNFREIVSTTNEYSQTLAHLAILYDYPSLLRHLVDWSIDLSISDVNGLTALHLAYMKGDLPSVRYLQRGGAPEAAKDRLGRIPSDLQPEGFGRGPDIDAEAHLPGNDNHEVVEFGGHFRAIDLDEDRHSGYDQLASEDGVSDAKEPIGISIDLFADGDEGGSGSGNVQIAPESKEPVIGRGLQILPSPPFDTSFNVSKNLCDAAPEPVDISTWGFSSVCDSGDGGGRNNMTLNDVESLKNGIVELSNNKENRDRDKIPNMNDVESLRNGIIKTSKNNKAAFYTIVLVGEPGVGKTSFASFIANALSGHSIDNYSFHDTNSFDDTDEQSGSANQSQASEARLHKFTSKNGTVVHILDTPGLIDTRGLQRARIHRKSIATEIQEHLDHVTAVIILVNGAVAPGTGSLHSTLSTLSTVFPTTWAKNIALTFTNVANPHSWNFCQETVPEVLKSAPQFHIDNPIALQQMYLKLKDDPSLENTIKEMHADIKVREQSALEALVGIFDWLDGLKRQPTTEAIALQEPSKFIKPRTTELLTLVEATTLLNFHQAKDHRASDSGGGYNTIKSSSGQPECI